MDISGKVKVIFDEQRFDSGFFKREFVITTEEQYPQDIKFELLKDKSSLITQYQVGDKIRVHFNLRGSEWNGKYFTNVVAWKIDAVAAGASQADGPGTPPEAAPMPTVAPVDLNVEDDDDLPF